MYRAKYTQRQFLIAIKFQVYGLVCHSFIIPPLQDLSYHSDSDEESAATLCSSVDVGGSPLYLPPTPGREEVDSILQRKSIAFS